jgi:chromosome segregation ATPase
MITDEITADETLDSRTLAERLEELQSERASLQDEVDDAKVGLQEATDKLRELTAEINPDASVNEDLAEQIQEAQENLEEAEGDLESAQDNLQDFLDEYKTELDALEKLEDECSGSSEWRHGIQFIRDDYFEKAMDEMLADCGDLPKDLPCYLTITVDYDMLKSDYSSVEFLGETYWYRS